MPIVITPSGEYVDSVTGNPVMNPRDPGSVAREGEMNAIANMDMQRLDPRSVVREGEMARENIPPNLDMGMDSMMPQNIDPRSVVREGERAAAELSDVDKVRMLIDMGLSPQEAMEAIARENVRPTVAPEEFGRMIDPGSTVREGEIAQMQGGQEMSDPMMRQQQMGALPMARPTPPPMPMQRPFDLSNMSAEQRDMVRRGIDPFAEGMMGR